MSTLLSGIWQKIVFGAVFVGLILLAVFKLIGIGRTQERAKAQGQILKDVETRHEIDRAVAGDANPADSLMRKWSRD